jgi:hypothetical protein
VVVDVFFRAGVGSSTWEEQLLGIALRLVNVKCLVEILKMFLLLQVIGFGWGVGTVNIGWLLCLINEFRLKVDCCGCVLKMSFDSVYWEHLLKVLLGSVS